MQRRPDVMSSKHPGPPGIIDTIADGLSVALAHPLLMLIPMLVDLYYWLGWKVVPAALTDRLAQVVRNANLADAQQYLDALKEMGGWDLTVLIALFVPSMLGGLSTNHLFQVWDRPVVRLDGWWLVCLMIAVLGVLATGIFMAYTVPLADAAMGRIRGATQIARAILIAWVRFIGLIAVIVGLGLLFGIPALLGVAIFLVIGVNLGPLVGSLAVTFGLAAAIFLYFAVDAIVVLEVGPLRAIYYSFNVVRRNFWPTVGFIAAAILISTGLPEVWQRLVDSPPGLLVAVIAHAFFAGGLAMASMIFFNDRLRQWRPDVAIQTASTHTP
ncbi:MAG TPA: hypothetical protein VFL82_13905 [Thermomicrobiales bacterium]|nr:hypothetical protein [Thermomicrobiales bacterium]